MDCQSSISFSLMMLSFKDGVCCWVAKVSLILQSKFVLPGVKMIPANDNQRQRRVFDLSRPLAIFRLRSWRWCHSQNLGDARYVSQGLFNQSRTVDSCNLIVSLLRVCSTSNVSSCSTCLWNVAIGGLDMFCNVWSPFSEGFKCSLCYSLSCFSHYHHLFLLRCINGYGRRNCEVNLAME